MSFRSAALTTVALLLLACSGKGPADNAAEARDRLPPGNALPPPEFEVVPPDESASPTDAWIGRWAGVEGLVLDIASADAPGRYALTVTLLDGTSRYEGVADGNVIHFTRAGRPETLRAVLGEETGLKYLAGKHDCLMIRAGEGFCRD
ncbi:hypothetical protein ACMT1E_06510 [Sphingomonas flavalba]|uniref:hypothetical protein n=1 Tax=Sphingomonas flavalba TaxID=2559804 RepID=UPI0039E18C1D